MEIWEGKPVTDKNLSLRISVTFPSDGVRKLQIPLRKLTLPMEVLSPKITQSKVSNAVNKVC